MAYKKLLLPFDGSDNAKMACAHAIDLAKAGDMRVVLLYCYGELPAVISGTTRDEILAASEAEGRRIIEPAARLCEDSGVVCEGMVHGGNPGRTIITVAQAEGCDCIVMGSRGLSDFSGMVMGSVAHRVLRHAAVPVLIVR
ncbi:MAG: universal stress protein [Desulfovibrio sp.]|jgi:nucleotide-binding universal stress UspA family protein|nr:universal stress protein [Desulfovibrio sp.]